MTVEEIKALLFNADALREPGYRIYQLNSEGYRYYYRFEGGEPVFYPSVTTLLRQVTPMSPWLLNWMLTEGKEAATEKRDLAAAYGTFMHGQFARLMIERKYDFDAVPEVLTAYLKKENLPDGVFFDWAGKIRKDVLAFVQFMRDYNVQPLAIEISLVHPEHRYAGCVDLVCLMTDAKTGEQYPAIVDFKSGRKGFVEDHELQLFLYRDMWNVNFPDLQVERIYNFAPKDWRKGPTYTLKEQTGAASAAKIPHLLALAAIEDEKRDNNFTMISGTLELDGGDLSQNILTLSLAELVKMRADKPAESDESAEAIELFPDADKPRKSAKNGQIGEE